MALSRGTGLKGLPKAWPLLFSASLRPLRVYPNPISLEIRTWEPNATNYQTALRVAEY